MPSSRPLEVRLSARAAQDFSDISNWSLEHFGLSAAQRYESLLVQAFIDLAADPRRPGARPRNEVFPGAWVYHMVSSRDRVSGERVKSPRHVMLYRITHPGLIDIVRILHDTQDPHRHLASEFEPLA